MSAEKPEKLSSHSQSIHWNGHIVCAIDTETTGLDPFHHEIIQVAIVPLKSDLTPNTKILPFYTEICPEHPERISKDAMRANKLNIEELISRGMDKFRVADLFDEWFQKLKLGFRKAIIPLAHNWPHDYAFMKGWLGQETFNQFFYGYRDTMSVMNQLNDIADMNNEPWPFPKMGLGSLCNRLSVINENPHDALADAVATAECYRRLVTRYKIYGGV